MISKIARATLQQWIDIEGLKPSIDDIILINALGLKLENGSETYNFSNCPRIAFLGDYILRQPSIRKQMWIDDALQLISDDLDTKTILMAYALYQTDEELPIIKSTKQLQKILIGFRKLISSYTDTQILTAIDYCMNGASQTFGEVFVKDEEQKKIFDIPDQIKSVTRQIWNEANLKNITNDKVTSEILERMVNVALINSGIDILKSEHIKNAGEYYMATGRIHERLKEDKAKQEDKEI